MFSTSPRSPPTIPIAANPPRNRKADLSPVDLLEGELAKGNAEGALRLYHGLEEQGVKCSVGTYQRLMRRLRDEGKLQEVLDLFEHMKHIAAPLTEGTYTTVISVCAQLKDAEKATAYFEELCRTEGLAANVFSYCALIDTCMKSGLYNRAQKHFQDMKSTGIQPSCAVYCTMIHGCGRLRDKKESADVCTELLVEMREKKLRMNTMVYGAAMTVYFRAGETQRVRALYSLMLHHRVTLDIGIFNMLFKFFSGGEKGLKDCLQFYSDMKEANVFPNRYTCNLLCTAAARAGDVEQVWKFVEDIEQQYKFPMECVSYNCIIQTYVQAFRLQKEVPNALTQCQALLERMEEKGVQPDDFTYNQLILLCRWTGDLEQGIQFFEEMKARGLPLSLITYTSMLKLYIEVGNPADGMLYLEPCFNLLTEMERQKMTLDHRVFSSILMACGRAKNAEMVQSVLARMKQHHLLPNRYIYNAVMNVYTSVNDIEEANRVFQTMLQQRIEPNVFTFAILLGPLVERNAVSEVMELLEQMKAKSVEPNDTIRHIILQLDTSNLRTRELHFIEDMMR